MPKRRVYIHRGHRGFAEATAEPPQPFPFENGELKSYSVVESRADERGVYAVVVEFDEPAPPAQPKPSSKPATGGDQ